MVAHFSAEVGPGEEECQHGIMPMSMELLVHLRHSAVVDLEAVVIILQGVSADVAQINVADHIECEAAQSGLRPAVLATFLAIRIPSLAYTPCSTDFFCKCDSLHYPNCLFWQEL